MELAIKEMRKSINEKRPDGKISPKVGAILVFPDDSVVMAHRGELRNGDHAEFTLLERKLGDKSLDNCVLYSTLEPCVLRSSNKKGCSKRTLNARIKEVYMGIEDPDPTVAGDGRDIMEKGGIRVKMFDRDLQNIIRKENKEYLEQAKHRAEKAVEPVVNLKSIVPAADFGKLSTEALEIFIKEADLDYSIESDEFKEYLTNIKILGTADDNQELVPTGMGIILFGKNPRTFYKQAGIKCSANFSEGKTEFKDFDEPLIQIPHLVEEWLNKVLPSSKDRSTATRKDITLYPLEPILEAVINALVHRDYEIEGTHSIIELDSEQIVIKSPGAPMPAISLAQLNQFNAPSLSRNPIITHVFSLMNLMEETGFGMSEFKSLYTQHHLPLPKFKYEDPNLTLTLFRTSDAERDSLKLSSTEISDEELLGLDWIKLKGIVSKKDYADHFNFDEKKAQRHLANFSELGLIEFIKAGRSSKYNYIYD